MFADDIEVHLSSRPALKILLGVIETLSSDSRMDRGLKRSRVVNLRCCKWTCRKIKLFKRKVRQISICKSNYSHSKLSLKNTKDFIRIADHTIVMLRKGFNEVQKSGLLLFYSKISKKSINLSMHVYELDHEHKVVC